MVDYRYYEELEDEAFEEKIKPKRKPKNKRKNGRNLTMSLKGIKTDRHLSYGLISLTGFNLFVGCSISLRTRTIYDRVCIRCSYGKR